MSGVALLAVCAAYAAIAARTLRPVVRDRASLFDADVTLHDRAVFERVVFLVGVPPGVLLHELGHAAATWQVGGTVVGWAWYLFAGHVRYTGALTPLQDWWIALAGNLVSIGLGFVAAACLALPLRPAWFYLTLAFARVQLVYALVGYPLLSLGAGWGDWTTIYSRQGGPWAMAMALAHAAALAALWRIGRSERYAAWMARRLGERGRGDGTDWA
ncbi:hypothetical protein DCC79_09885 [bacterium]|nr:MAG: hypothetical protein DCC79_09885 [bacterium]